MTYDTTQVEAGFNVESDRPLGSWTPFGSVRYVSDLNDDPVSVAVGIDQSALAKVELARPDSGYGRLDFGLRTSVNNVDFAVSANSDVGRDGMSQAGINAMLKLRF